MFGCDDGALYAVEVTSGLLKWRAEGAGPIWTTPIVRDDTVYAGSTDGTFKAVDRSSGRLRWTRHMEGRICSTAYAAAALIFFGCTDGHVYALDSASGRDAWTYVTGDGVIASPAVAAGMVVVGSEDFYVYALDAGTGALRWKFEPDLGIASSAAVADGRVFLGGKDGFVYALSLTDGKEIWKSKSLRTITASPMASDEIVCIQSVYGSTQAYDSKTGEELWRANLGGSLQSTPIVTDEAVICDLSGIVLCAPLSRNDVRVCIDTAGGLSSLPARLPRSSPPAAVLHGTMFDIIAYHASRPNATAVERAMAEIVRLDQVMSDYKADSDLSTLNREGSRGFMSVEPTVATHPTVVDGIEQRPVGVFDVTIAPLLKAWKRAKLEGRPPWAADIAAARRCVGYDKIETNSPRIPFGSALIASRSIWRIWKRYAVDRAIALLKAAGINSALVNGGGSSIASIGAPPGAHGWPVRLGASSSSNTTLLLRDRALSTIGNSTRWRSDLRRESSARFSILALLLLPGRKRR